MVENTNIALSETPDPAALLRVHLLSIAVGLSVVAFGVWSLQLETVAPAELPVAEDSVATAYSDS